MVHRRSMRMRNIIDYIDRERRGKDSAHAQLIKFILRARQKTSFGREHTS